MDARKQTYRLLKEIGAVLQRKKKHEVWKLPTGQIFVQAATPSDKWHQAQKSFCELKKVIASPGRRA
jgi:hypothetical protein